MTYYVYSTATCSATYVNYEQTPPTANAIAKKWPDGRPMKINIKGGHGIADKHFYTPKGVVTVLTDEEMDVLLNNKSFLRHQKAGHISYEKKNVAPEKKAANMADKDGSAPLTPKDFMESENSTAENKIYKEKK